MIPQFDIFRMKKSEYVWQEATMTLVDAEAWVHELGAAEAGEYLIFDQKTCGRILLRLEHQAKSESQIERTACQPNISASLAQADG
jgi:hypothetical protein